jgi:hypothetical protein
MSFSQAKYESEPPYGSSALSRQRATPCWMGVVTLYWTHWLQMTTLLHVARQLIWSLVCRAALTDTRAHASK